MKKSEIKYKENFLEYIPVRNIEWDKNEKERVYLIKEKSKKKFMKKMIWFFNKSQVFKIHLDELGTSSWLLIDGKRTIYEIIQEMKKNYEGKLDQAEQRVSNFFILLRKNKFVEFLLAQDKK